MDMAGSINMGMENKENYINETKRIQYYDVLKGFAIFIVAFGHCMLTFNPDIKESYISNAIQLIQMPLFIAISGFFFNSTLKKYELTEIFKRKFNHLYRPSLCWGIIGASLMLFYKMAAGKELDLSYFITSIFTGMWFLTALFILSVIGAILYNYIRAYFFLAWWLIFGIIYFINHVWMINEIKFLLPFFVMAIFFRDIQRQQPPLWLFLISTILYIGFIKIYDWEFTLYSMEKNNTVSWKYFYINCIRIIGGWSGIICIIYLCKLISQVAVLNNILSYIGKMTLPIYVIHQNFLLIPKFLHYKTDNWIIIFTTTIVILTLSIIAYKIIKGKTLRKYLFGEY